MVKFNTETQMNMIDRRLNERIAELEAELKADESAKAYNANLKLGLGQRKVSMNPYVLEGQRQLLSDLIARRERRLAR